MTRIGTPLSPTATRVLLCGCGELGKEVVIELQRLGVDGAERDGVGRDAPGFTGDPGTAPALGAGLQSYERRHDRSSEGARDRLALGRREHDGNE